MVQFSCSVVSDSLQPHRPQHTRPPCPSPTPGACSNSCPLIGDAIQPSHPLSFPSPPAFNLSQHQGLFKWVSSSHHCWYRTGNLFPKGMRQSTGCLVDYLYFFDVSVFILRFPWVLYSAALCVSHIGNPCSWKMGSVGHVLLPTCWLPHGWHWLPPVSKAFKSAKVETQRESGHFFQPLSDHCAPAFPAHPPPYPPLPHQEYLPQMMFLSSVQFSSFQSLSHVWLFATPWTAAC